jgi:hypothetical protein
VENVGAGFLSLHPFSVALSVIESADASCSPEHVTLVRDQNCVFQWFAREGWMAVHLGAPSLDPARLSWLNFAPTRAINCAIFPLFLLEGAGRFWRLVILSWRNSPKLGTFSDFTQAFLQAISTGSLIPSRVSARICRSSKPQDAPWAGSRIVRFAPEPAIPATALDSVLGQLVGYKIVDEILWHCSLWPHSSQ